MFNVDQSADYLGGYMGNPLDSQEPKRKQVSPPSSAIPYKSEAQGQKDLIMKHQKFLLDHMIARTTEYQIMKYLKHQIMNGVM